MQRQTELTRENVRHTELIKFWSEGKIAQSAYDRVNLHRANKRTDLAKSMMDEWVI